MIVGVWKENERAYSNAKRVGVENFTFSGAYRKTRKTHVIELEQKSELSCSRK